MKISGVVVDASYALSWLLPDEERPTLRPEHKFAPELLRYEIVNALRSNVVQKRIDRALAEKLLGVFDGWQIQYQPVDMKSTLDLAIGQNLSGYDASYLWLARKLKIKLLTWDKKLEKLASA